MGRLATEESVSKFRDAPYGLFIHYGLSSFKVADLSWSRESHVFPDPGKGTIPDGEYDGFAERVKMERFNATEWVETARRAGFKYIVVIAKHHDGFHMWDTAYSEHKITNSPFGRDYLKELADACHKSGIPLGVYYSQRDWYHPDYQPLDPAVVKRIPDPPYWKPIGGAKRRAGPKHRQYIEYQCCPGKVAPTDGKSLPLNVLWPVLSGNDLKFRGRKWPPERSIPTRHNGG